MLIDAKATLIDAKDVKFYLGDLMDNLEANWPC